jgi:hypothetical protein
MTPSIVIAQQVSHRDLRLLAAAGQGRVECSSSVEPDFFVDGFAYCDHTAARALVRAGLLRPSGAGQNVGRRHVELTADGHDRLTATATAG